MQKEVVDQTESVKTSLRFIKLFLLLKPFSRNLNYGGGLSEILNMGRLAGMIFR